MSLAECQTAEQVRLLARRVAERRRAQYTKPVPVIRPKLEPEPLPVIEVVTPPEQPVVVPSIRHIQNVVCTHFQVPFIDLVSQRRTPSLIFTRMVAVWLARQLTTKTTTQIGHAFGGRDHSTIIHSVRRIDAAREIDPTVLELTTYFVNLLQTQAENAR